MNNLDIEKSLEKLGRETEPRPSMVSAVMQRIDQLPDINQQPTHGLFSFGRIYRAAAVFAAVAACVAALFFASHADQSPKPRTPIVKSPHKIPADQNEDSVPRLIDYQRALTQSPEALEALLQQRPLESYPVEERVLRVADGMHSDSHLY